MTSKISHQIVEAQNSPLPPGFLTDLPRLFREGGVSLYKKRNEIKRFDINGQTVCVKRYGIPPLFNRVLYSLGWRMPKAKRTYENAQEILNRGFSTPRQYGYVLEYKNGWLGDCFSVGEYIEDIHSLEDSHQDEALLRAFATYTAQLHEHGMMHRDYILNNILYRREGEEYKFTLIDINRFVFRDKPIRGFLQRLNLMQPFNRQTELKKFVQAYTAAAHAPLGLCKQVACMRRWRTRYSELKRLLKKIPGAKRIANYR